MTVSTRLGLMIVSVALASASLGAHHSFAMFDMEKNVEYSGVVTEWKWQNPHVHFNVLVKPGPGVASDTAGTWDVEGGSVNIMSRQGWTRASYKVGDPIRLVGHPSSRSTALAGRQSCAPLATAVSNTCWSKIERSS